MPSGPTIPRRNDEELALAAQGGCRASFEQLVRRYQVPLTHFLRQRASAHEAEDLVQDTFLRAYENLYRYRPAHRFRTWLFTIARRLNFNRMRKRRPAADSDLLRWLASPVRTAEAVADEESRRKLWQTAAEVLSYRQWTALWLYYVEDMPVKEIARVVGRSRVAVKTMLFRARKKLLPLLEPPEPHTRGDDHNTADGNPRRPVEVTHE